MGVTEMGGPMGMGWYKAWLIVIMETDKGLRREELSRSLFVYAITSMAVLAGRY